MTRYKKVKIDGLDIFYREAGSPAKPAILLLHGFPTSSHMFRNLLTSLEDKYYLIAPDYPGFGQSSMPSVDEFEYSFDNLAAVVEKFIDAVGLKKFSLYLMDYGAPVGFRIAQQHPERIQALLIQNGNAYEEGLKEFWEPIRAYWRNPGDKDAIEGVSKLLTIEATQWQYTHGVQDPERISPDTWTHDQALLDRPGNKDIQLRLFLSYGTNPALYPGWQAYFREHQPPALITWGEHDYIFPADGAYPYQRDLKNVEFHLLNAGHFALEDHGADIAQLIDGFLSKNIR
ncbi:alpha/beta hydrolase [Chitinophaga lutea]|uniref:Alpha/beta hydrolase n=1 Tax=Chitinophaga lutea TaxID=2488634 RepID=A0A3N4PT55_9BACT|nr:alpha/beta hydrolase [Chitinophaga lutea]RPE09959.1 alpha/beta hydrolase [Chitinophaga lutea]